MDEPKRVPLGVMVVEDWETGKPVQEETPDEEIVQDLVWASKPDGSAPGDFTVPVRARDMWLLARRIVELEAKEV